MKTSDNINAFRLQTYQTIRKLFSETIKESFLIEILDSIEKDPRFSRLIVNPDNFNRMMSMHTLVIGSGSVFLTISKMVVMCHYMNTVMLNEREKGAIQKDNNYKQKLIDDVFKMYQLERWVVPGLSSSSLEPYLPIIYYLTTLVNYCGGAYDQILEQHKIVKKGYNNDFNALMIYKFLNKVKACISLADSRTDDELIIIFRTLIEQFVVYSLLWDESDECIRSFEKFDELTFEYNYRDEIDATIRNRANKIGTNPVSYLNYGWIENLSVFKKASSSKKTFSFATLCELFDEKYPEFENSLGSSLYVLYRSCNPQVHATSFQMNHFELELKIFWTISVMMKFVCEIINNLYGIIFKLNGLDLVNELNTSLKELVKVVDWLGSDNDKLRKTNQDYIKRAVCSLKLRSN